MRRPTIATTQFGSDCKPIYGRGRNLYRGIVKRGDGRVIWECPHEHPWSAHAVICATDELHRRADVQQGLAL